MNFDIPPSQQYNFASSESLEPEAFRCATQGSISQFVLGLDVSLHQYFIRCICQYYRIGSAIVGRMDQIRSEQYSFTKSLYPTSNIAFVLGLPFHKSCKIPQRSCPFAYPLRNVACKRIRRAKIHGKKMPCPVATTGLPLSPKPPFDISYKQVCMQLAESIADMTQDSEQRLLTVDFPPERSEARAGTLVSRFENNINMCEKLLEYLQVQRNTWSSIGGTVQICDNMYVPI